ncbi:MAG: hypothetical protein HRU80_10115 [Ignavibacteriales bacterium]|nr:hypothetical protein [Ignavibacteriaceae bacterium]QOJ29220.1 MAG: hypothetical protein HRU80_10115 [Ignavibacteriales bacterium]
MKLKSYLLGTFIFAVILITIYVIVNIYTSYFDYGGAGLSDDIEFSKRLGVFSYEYVVEPEILKIDSTFTLRFGEAWAEKSWVHGNYFKPVKEPSRDEWKGYTLYIEIIETVDFSIEFYKKYSVHTIDNDSTKNSFAMTYVGGEKSFLRSSFRKLDKNEIIIHIKERKTDSTKADRRTAFFTIRKK